MTTGLEWLEELVLQVAQDGGSVILRGMAYPDPKEVQLVIVEWENEGGRRYE